MYNEVIFLGVFIIDNTVKEHFIPQFYLKKFADKNEMLYIYNPRTNAKYIKSVRNYGFKNNLYETKFENANEKMGKYVLRNNIEKCFSEYESRYSKLLRRLDDIIYEPQNKDVLICNKTEKAILFSMVANFYFRNPYIMKQLNVDEIEDFMEIDEIRLVFELLDKMGIGGGKSIFKAAKKKVLLTEEYEEGPLKEFINSISKIPFTFLYNSEGRFITCNQPVSIGKDRYINDKDNTCIYMPLSPYMVFLAGDYDNIRANKITVVSKENMDVFNLIYCNYASESGADILFNSESDRKEIIKRLLTR